VPNGVVAAGGGRRSAQSQIGKSRLGQSAAGCSPVDIVASKEQSA
jgi:hypothetical protein